MGNRDEGSQDKQVGRCASAVGPAKTTFVGQANPTSIVATLAPLLLGIKDAGSYVGVGRSTIYQAVKDGELTLIKIRGRSLLRVSALNDWVNSRLAQP